MTPEQLAAMLSFRSRGTNIAQNKEKVNEELFNLGLLSWVFPTHSTPGFHQVSAKGKYVIDNVLDFARELP